MIQIQKAAPTDFLAIAALDRAAWKSNRHSEFIPDGEHVWRIWCEHALTFVARDEKEEIVGVLLAFPCLDGPYCLHKIMVSNPAVDKASARNFFDVLLEELDKRKVDCFLTVDPQNQNAIALYRKQGYLEEKFVAGFYRPEEDRLVLTRRAV